MRLRIPTVTELLVFVAIGMVMAWGIALPFSTWHRASAFRDNGSLWRDAASKSPNKLRPALNIAADLADQHHDAEAVEWLRRARSLVLSAHLTQTRQRGYLVQIDSMIAFHKLKIDPHSDVTAWMQEAIQADPKLLAKWKGLKGQ